MAMGEEEALFWDKRWTCMGPRVGGAKAWTFVGARSSRAARRRKSKWRDILESREIWKVCLFVGWAPMFRARGYYGTDFGG